MRPPPDPAHGRHLDVAVFVSLSVLWLAMILVANPRGEFPINDDWSYLLAVKALVEHGQYRLTDWTSMPLLTQVLWGAAFCLPKGVSFEALRASTLVMGWIGVLATYGLLRLVSGRAFAAIGAIVVATNPIVFASACTFMTDVPFLAIGTLAAWLLITAARSEGLGWLAAGLVACVAATLLRQLGVAFAAAYAVMHVYQHGWRPRSLIRAALPLVACLAALSGYNAWLARTQGLPGLYNTQNASVLSALGDPLRTAARASGSLLRSGLYLGLFALPALLLFPRRPGASHSRSRSTWVVLLLATAAFIVGTFLLISRGELMPLYGTVWFDFGLGPILMRDGPRTEWRHWPTLSREGRLLLTALACAGAVWLAARVVDALTRAIQSARCVRGKRPAGSPTRADRAPVVFAASFVAVYVGLVALLGADVFDRYLIVPLSFLLLLTGATVAPARGVEDERPTAVPHVGRRSSHVFRGIALYAFAGFAVAGTHDLFAFNRARWAMLGAMTDAGVSPSDIDGGFEFNGLHRYAGYRLRPGEPGSPMRSDACEYIVGSGELPGYAIVDRRGYRAWLAADERAVVLLRRIDLNVPPPGKNR